MNDATSRHLAISRRGLVSTLAAVLALWPGMWAWAQDDPLPSWNDGAAK